MADVNQHKYSRSNDDPNCQDLDLTESTSRCVDDSVSGSIVDDSLSGSIIDDPLSRSTVDNSPSECIVNDSVSRSIVNDSLSGSFALPSCSKQTSYVIVKQVPSFLPTFSRLKQVNAVVYL